MTARRGAERQFPNLQVLCPWLVLSGINVVAPPSGREWIHLIPNVVGEHLRLEPVAPFWVAAQRNFDGSGYPIPDAG